MTGWTEFVLAMAAFAGSHFVPRLWGLRARLIGTLGRRVYFSLYGALSLVILAWVILAAGRAPFVPIWPQEPWMRWIPNLAMPLVLMLATMGLGIRQPHTVGAARTAAFDPENPGLAAVTRHPLLVALTLWAGAHTVPNGDLAHVILFGGFAALSLAAIALFDARARRREPALFFERTAILSPRPLLDPAWWGANGRRLGLRAAIGLVLWAGLLHGHAAFFGVSPLPF